MRALGGCRRGVEGCWLPALCRILSDYGRFVVRVDDGLCTHNLLVSYERSDKREWSVGIGWGLVLRGGCITCSGTESNAPWAWTLYISAPGVSDLVCSVLLYIYKSSINSECHSTDSTSCTQGGKVSRLLTLQLEPSLLLNGSLRLCC